MTSFLTTGAPSRGLTSHGAMFVVALFAAAVMGVALAYMPILALLPFAALGLVLLLVNAPFRTAFVVFGGLAVLQSSQEMNLIKFAYLLGTGVAFIAALFNLRHLEATRSYRLLRPLLSLSLLFAALVGLSLGVSIAYGTPVTAWLRDAAPYLLFAAVPVFALDLQSAAPRKLLVFMLVVAGVLASLSYTLEWLDRRSLADLPISRILLPSGGLRAGLYVYAISGALLTSRRWIGWAGLGALVLALTWITGNRGSSLFLPAVVPLIGLFAAKRDWNLLRPSLRMLAIGGAAVLLTAVFMLALTWFGDYDRGRHSAYFESAVTFFADPNSDGSYRERLGQTSAAWDAFSSSPILGVGPGYVFEWTDYKGDPLSFFTIDTGLAIPAKFGIAGVVMLVALSIAYLAFLRKASAASAPTIAHVALVAFAVLAIIRLPFSTPFEDKGFSFGLLFLLALSLPEERERGQK